MNSNERALNLHSHADGLVKAKLFDSIAWQVNRGNECLSSGQVSSATVPNKPIYRIYSMTKPIVSVLALQLIEQGLLQLNSPVSKYLPAMGSLKVCSNANGGAGSELGAKAMTIAHLLTHTAGFSYDFIPNCSVANQYRQIGLTENAERSLEEYVRLLSDLPLASQPGETWRYSVATDVLAHVLEVVSAKPLPELMADNILRPLGMAETGFCVNEKQFSRVMPMFGSRNLGEVMSDSDAPNELVQMDVGKGYPLNSQSFYRGGHGLYSTLDDYLLFAQMLRSGKSVDGESILSTPMVNMMWANRIPASMQPLWLAHSKLSGYGWNLMGRVMLDIGSADVLTSAGEGGWSGAAATYFWVDRNFDLTGVVMTQYLGSTTPVGQQLQSLSYAMCA